MLRPRPARWFEILTARDDATLVLEALARTGAVELDARPGAGLPADPEAVLPLLTQFAELETRYAAYWPPASACRPSPFPDAPAHALQQALRTVQAWAQDAEPHIRALQRAEAEATELQLWARVLDARAGSPLPAHELASAGPLVQARLFVLPPGADAAAALAAMAGDEHTLASVLDIDQAPHLLVAGAPAALHALAQRVSTLKGSSHELPAWLRDPALDPAVHVPQRLHVLALLTGSERAALQALETQHALPRALGDVHRLQWLLDNVHALEAGTLLCWVTGWCSDPGGQPLANALQVSGARALLRHGALPEGLHAPLLLQNPPWARPFELFSRALGMPASTEADPSVLLALAVPLMFGYMFGDVGQGLVLAAGGWWLRRRFAVARLLMVGGLSATAFGFVFGSCFGLHGLPFMPPALWLHPLDAPLAVLLAPLVGGAVLLTLGLGLDALAAFWRGEAARWLRTDLWLIVTYLGLLTAFVEPAAGWVAAFGALAWCVGHAVQHGRVTAAFSALGEGLEKTLQILINTLSFARVGAFALAHAGLSSALVALMDAADSGIARALVLVLGNAVVIVLEAMVVSIQTTRLVLFEFFTRFMQGSGRVFRPLPAPPYATLEPPRRPECSPRP